jgi:hypothetical protein
LQDVAQRREGIPVRRCLLTLFERPWQNRWSRKWWERGSRSGDRNRGRRRSRRSRREELWWRRGDF